MDSTRRRLAARARRVVPYARALLAPEDRLLPGLGARLEAHPQVAAAMLTCVRRLPGRRLRAAGQRHVSRPLIQRLATSLDVPVSRSRMRIDTADVFGRAVAVHGVWEPHVTAAFRSLLSRGDVCVDVGANAGYYTLLAAELVTPHGHVYALEPAPRTHAALAVNVALNGYSNVTALRVAAGEAPGEAFLDSPAQPVMAAIQPRSGGAPGARVRVAPVASLVPAADLERLRLIKIDVEGYEAAVLRGVEPLFERGLRPALLVELHAGRGEDAALLLLEMSRRYGLRADDVVDGDGGFRLEPWTEPAIREDGVHVLLRS